MLLISSTAVPENPRSLHQSCQLFQGLAYSADFAAIGLICVRWAPLSETAIYIAILTSFTPVSAIATNAIAGFVSLETNATPTQFRNLMRIFYLMRNHGRCTCLGEVTHNRSLPTSLLVFFAFWRYFFTWGAEKVKYFLPPLFLEERPPTKHASFRSSKRGRSSSYFCLHFLLKNTASYTCSYVRHLMVANLRIICTAHLELLPSCSGTCSIQIDLRNVTEWRSRSFCSFRWGPRIADINCAAGIKTGINKVLRRSTTRGTAFRKEPHYFFLVEVLVLSACYCSTFVTLATRKNALLPTISK